MQRLNLYFIALVPHQELCSAIKLLKKEMKEQFNASHALNSPAHITLQMPFKRKQEEESVLVKALERFALNQHPFNVELEGFGSFTSRVIFVNVKEPELICSLYANLKITLTDLGFISSEISSNLYPHMTIASRDLSKEAFYKAWPEFENRSFSASFEAKSIFLLKHVDKHWNILREFEFFATPIQ